MEESDGWETVEVVDDDPDVCPEHGDENTGMVQLLPSSFYFCTVAQKSMEQRTGQHTCLLTIHLNV